MTFNGYALFKGFNKILVTEIWRVLLRAEGGDVVRYSNHYCRVHPAAVMDSLVDQMGIEMFALDRLPLSPDYRKLPIVIQWEKDLGIYPQAIWS